MEDSLYREVLLDHYWNPRNSGTLPHPDATAEEDNPLCGDRVRLDLQFSNGKIADVKFSGTGCAISQAATSMLTEKLTPRVIPAFAKATAGRPSEHTDESRDLMTINDAKKISDQDMLTLLGIPVSPARLKCALLGLRALQRAIGVIK